MAPTIPKITLRRQRRVLAATADSQAVVERVLTAFINQGFWARLGWVCFGARTPADRWRTVVARRRRAA